ncbi:MAG: O-antigen ligase family protein [Lachnospiraceae bacterium]|nr:O-antigen ligase family protein [Lachnospiraceae bacterium]
MLSQKSGYYHRLIFKAVVIFTQLISCVAYIHTWIAPYQKILLGWGALLIVLELFRGFKPWKQLGTVLFCVFLIAYLGSIFLADKAYLSANLHAFFYMVMMFLVFYALDAGDRAQRAKEYAVLANVMIITIFVMTAVGLYIAVTIKKGKHYTTELGEIGNLGILRRRFSGIVNANTGGALYAIAILLSALMMHRKGRGRILLNILYFLIIVAEVLALYLSYCRTAIYALAVAVSAYLFWQLPNRIRPLGRMKNPGKLIIRVLAAAIVLVTVFLSVFQVREALYARLRQLRKWYKESSVMQVVSAAEDDVFLLAAAETAAAEEEDEDFNLADELRGRADIWKAAVEIIKENPVWGISNEAIEDALSARTKYYSYHAHSTYLTVLLASGAVGGLLLTVFTGRGLCVLWKRRRFLWRTASAAVFGPALLVLFMLVREMTETTLIFRLSFFACLYWEALGAMRQELADAEEPAA